MPKTIRLAIDKELWSRARRASADYSFRAGDLLNWVLESESDKLDEWAEELHDLAVDSE